MTFGTRVLVALAPLATVLLASGCGAGDKSEVVPEAMAATMTDGGCVYEGETSPAKGPLTVVHVQNQSTRDGTFVLATIAAGATRHDVAAWVAKLRRSLPRARFDKSLTEPPYRMVLWTDVVSGAVGELPAFTLAGGTYAVMCLQESPPGTLAALYIAKFVELPA